MRVLWHRLLTEPAIVGAVAQSVVAFVLLLPDWRTGLVAALAALGIGTSVRAHVRPSRR